MTKLVLAISSPFTEKTVTASDDLTKIQVGIKAYSFDEIKDLQAERTKVSNSYIAAMERLEAQKAALSRNLELSDSDFATEVEELSEKAEQLEQKFSEQIATWTKQHILFVKNVDVGGAIGKIKDTRQVPPVEGFWETPEECLESVVDALLNSIFFRAALIETVTSTIFKTKKK